MTDRVLLIVPCFNEALRLDIESFTAVSSNIQILFANDGSTDQTVEALKSLIDNQRFHLFDSPNNMGKANIIQSAYQYALQKDLLREVDWIGYWDADLATPLYEVNNMLQYAKTYDGVKSIWGSRILRLGADINRSFIRHLLGRCFATLFSSLFKIKTYDSQCGAKLFSKDLAEVAFQNFFITNWIFDVEILLRLNHNPHIIEYPLKQWKDIAGSKIHLFKDSVKILKDIYALWKTY